MFALNSMFVRLGTGDISKPSKIAPISFDMVAFKWLELWRTARIALFGGLKAFGEQSSSCVIIEWQHFLA